MLPPTLSHIRDEDQPRESQCSSAPIPDSLSLVWRTDRESAARTQGTGDLRLEPNSSACRHHARRLLTFTRYIFPSRVRCFVIGVSRPIRSSMETTSVPTASVAGFPITYQLMAYGADGRERQDDPGGLMSRRALDSPDDPPVTEVLLLSHGWRGDVPAARTQYNRWIGAMAGAPPTSNVMKKKRPGFRPCSSACTGRASRGATTPSQGAASFDTAGADPVEELVNEAAARTVDTPAARAALRTIVAAALDDNNPPRLPPEVQAAYAVLDREIRPGPRRRGRGPRRRPRAVRRRGGLPGGPGRRRQLRRIHRRRALAAPDALVLEDEGPGPPLRRVGGTSAPGRPDA